MAARAQDRHPSVDGMRADEPRPAARTGVAGVAVDLEPFNEASALATRVPIITKAGTAGGDRLAQHAHDSRMHGRCFICRNGSCGARGVDACTKECLVRVDVADADYGALIHQKLLDGLSRTPKKDR